MLSLIRFVLQQQQHQYYTLTSPRKNILESEQEQERETEGSGSQRVQHELL